MLCRANKFTFFEIFLWGSKIGPKSLKIDKVVVFQFGGLAGIAKG